MDWKVTINAAPGTYSYLCWLHPGMTGTVIVAESSQPATTQAQVDTQAAAQFSADQAAARALEQAVVVVGGSGRKSANVGLSNPDWLDRVSRSWTVK